MAVLLLPFLLSAQQNPLNRRVTVNLAQVRLDDALFALGGAAGFDFSYNARMFPSDRLVDVYASETQVRKVLSQILGPEYVVRPLGNHLVIAPRAREPKDADTRPSYWVEGYLIDAATGEKVHFATVYAGLKAVTYTDSAGHYRLQVASGTQELPISFSKRGYHDTVMVIRPDRNPLLTLGIRPRPEFDQPIASREVSVIGDRAEEPFPLVDLFVSEEQQALADNLDDPIKTYPFQISLLPALGTNRLLSGAMENNFSLNILAGYSNGLRGLEIGGLANVDRGRVIGCQIGGLTNLVGGAMRGLQIGGLINHVKGDVAGVQIAGLINFCQSDVSGLQIAGLVNFTPRPVKGIQISGLMSYAQGDVEALQIGGLLNYARGRVGGFQVGGLGSYAQGEVGRFQIGGLVAVTGGNVGGFQIGGLATQARGDVGGFQLAGLANRASGDVRGFQMAGIYNRARTVNGIQIGLVNVADSSAGYQLGLVNVVRRGYSVLEMGGNEIFHAQVAYKAGRRSLHNYLTAAYRLGPRTQALAYGAGLGTGFRSGPMSLSLDLSCLHVAESHFGFMQLNLMLPARLSVGLNLGRWELYGGAATVMQVTGAQDRYGNFRTQIAPRTFWRHDSPHTRVQAWIGWQAGIRIGLWPSGLSF